ncbi:MAG: Hsp33 family molecular chaperone HslO [Pseudomonadota bacterium]
MTVHDRNSDNRDTLKRFVFENFDVRGKLVHLDAAWRAMMATTDYPETIRALLGEAAAATALLASTIKFDGRLTLQVQGGGDLSLLVVQCSSGLALRGMASWQGDNPQGDFASLVGDGRMVFTIDANSEGQRYQGIVETSGASLAECIQGYFENSEQLPTRLWLSASQERATGMLLQRMPPASRAQGSNLVEEDVDAWQRVQLLADTITNAELMQLPDGDVLRRLFHEEDLRVFEALPVSFRCQCSQERVANTLRMLGKDEVQSILEEEGAVKVNCDFCNRAYSFDGVDVALLFASDAPPGSATLQ